MKKIFGTRVSHGSIGTLSILVLLYFVTQGRWTNAADLKKARVSQVIQDVKLLGANAVPRPASVNDNVGEGTAVRTGVESRAELTFTDLTITRLGANSVFSFKEGTRDINLESGSVLVQVPPNAPAARIKTPAVTAAISGGTGMFGTGPPSKFMVLEGTGTFYPTGHPEEAVTLHGGEMVMMTPDGHITAPAKFDVKEVLATSALIVDFAELANLPLILNVINEQQTQLATENPPLPQQKDSVDIVSERIAASPTPTPTPTPSTTPTPTPSPSVTPTPSPSVTPTPTPSVTPTPTPSVTPTPTPSATPTPSPSVTPTPSPSVTPTPSPSVTPTPSPSVTPTPSPSVTPTPTPIFTPTPTPSGSPSKFGTPTVITSPNPYVVSSATTISTDPAITTNGVTDYGKVWRGQATDGPLSAFIFGSTSGFDIASGFDTELNGQNNSGGAGFKFTALQLTGNPTVSTTNGEINLGLIAVDSITSGAPGGTLTFAGIRGLLLATQAGPINLGPEISFSGLHDINFYARGSGSDLTLGSAISVQAKIRLFAEGRIQVNGAESATDFRAFSGGDFLAGSGFITATSSIDIHADSNVNFNLRQFPEGTNIGQTVTINAGNNINIDTTGDQTVLSNASTINVTAGNTLNMTGANPTTLNLNVMSPATFSAGIGGIQGSTVAFSTIGGLDLQSGGDINVYAADIPPVNNSRTISGTINAVGAISTTGNVTSGDVTAGSTINVGADLFVSNATAGTTINVAGQLSAFGTVTAGGNITAKGVDVENINAPNGVLTVGNNGIRAFVVSPGGAAVHETFNVNSIISPAGIDYSGNQFGGIDGLSSGGLLTINARTITFDPSTGIGLANFNGADAGSFSNAGPASGGDGGTFIVNTTGAITVNSDIEATSGSQSGSASPSGNGGTVNLNSSGDTVSISSRIQVSSADSTDTSFQIRRSAQGGNVNIQSGKTTGVAINVGSSSQLLSLLAAAAPGPGGKITIVATNAGGASTSASSSTNTSSINIDNTNGRIEDDRGTVQVEHDGDAGSINVNNANIRADIVKVGALGANGTLTIGGGSINADTILKLYATGSNGQLNFIANATLSSGSAMYLAANKITIQPSFVVTINGAGGKANIFTNNPNYNFTPGAGYAGPTPNPANGTFGGNGAKDPQPLTSAPGF